MESINNYSIYRNNIIKKCSVVKWSLENGTAEGKVQETLTSKITKTIKGNDIAKNC